MSPDQRINDLHDGTKDALFQMERYGGRVFDEKVLAALWALTNVNDDLWHGRDEQCVRESVAGAQAALARIVAPAAPELLTDEQILRCFHEAVPDYVDVSDAEVLAFGRAVMSAMLDLATPAPRDDDQEWDRNAERLTREAFGLGGGINPNATSVDDLFAEPLRDARLDLMRRVTQLPRAGTPAADLTERERLAVCVAAGAPYETAVHDGVLTVRTTAPCVVTDRSGGGYDVFIGRTPR